MRVAIPLFLLLPLVAPCAPGEATWPGNGTLATAVFTQPSAAHEASLRAERMSAYAKGDFASATAFVRLARLNQLLTAASAKDDAVTKFLLNHRVLAEEFADLITPEDNPRAVVAILRTLLEAEPGLFTKYPRTAMAIALVYDTQPPRSWPHSQVSPGLLPRRMPAPLDAFRFFAQSAEEHRLARDPEKLGIDELAFVVATVTPIEELRECQRRKVTPAKIPDLYPSIKYDMSRIADMSNPEYMWNHEDYKLTTIAKKGGICVDQAYYTMAYAQSLGIPAMIFSGSGVSGKHAFVGYLEKPGKWRTDVGRYAQHKYASGSSVNPRTWNELSDHELVYLEERFHTAKPFVVSELHALAAREKIAAGDLAAAAALVAQAKGAEPRNEAVWQLADLIAEKRGDTAEAREKLFAEAAKALSRCRDQEVYWLTRLADSLESRGKAEAAFEQRMTIVTRNVRSRPDLAMDLAATLIKTASKKDTKTGLAVFNRLTGKFEEGGVGFFEAVVEPFVTELLDAGQKKEAAAAYKTVSRKIKPERGSQLEAMMKKLEAKITAP